MKKYILCLAIVALMSLPVMAEGWFVELDFWYVQPDNSFLLGEFVDVDGSGDQDFTPASFDFDEDLSWDFAFGYDSDDYGIFTFSYWTYGDNTSFFTDDSDWEVNVDWGFNFDHHYNFETDAYTVDMTWGQHWGNDGGWTGTWYMGLRIFDYEFSETYWLEDDVFDTFDMHGRFTNETSGFGFCGGFLGQRPGQLCYWSGSNCRWRTTHVIVVRKQLRAAVTTGILSGLGKRRLRRQQN